MASSLSFLSTALIVIVAMNSSAGSATEFRVGDSEGWRKPGLNETNMYELWAERNRFRVGDSLCKFVKIPLYLLLLFYVNFLFGI